MRIIKINPDRQEVEAIREAVRILKARGLIVFPTETVYGLGANALDKNAVKKIFKAKGRPENKALIILIKDIKDLKKFARNIPPIAYKLARKFWPGPLTMVFRKKKIISNLVSGGTNTIAIRISPHRVVKALVKELGMPLTAPSANISGEPAQRTVKKLIRDFKNTKEIGLILDAGKTPIGKPSTLIDLTKKAPAILRKGVISRSKIEVFLTRK